MSVPSPTPEQLAWQRMRLGMFLHFGVNTFFGAEWSDGTLPAEAFDPKELDADQWADVAASMGARYAVLTAKHHDGFCLWPTATTDYSVASSPWRDGRGDVVGEFVSAFRRRGIAVGLYLSPWDRNAACYEDAAAYDDFYCTQLEELCTRYGDLVELWFDGAGSDGREYDWDRIMAVVREHQPGAMVFNMGSPTIRWVGNEDGMACDPVEYVTDLLDLNNYGDVTMGQGAGRYLPPECDVSLRRGWFWAEDDQPKSLNHLLGIHYRSIGMGAGLLLNVPPDRRGLIPEEDVARLREWRDELDSRFGHPVEARLERDGKGWRAVFPEATRLDHVALEEDYSDGQRITRHRVLLDGRLLAEGLTVGEHRLHAFAPAEVTELAVEVEGDEPRLARVLGFDTGGRGAPDLEYIAPTVEPESISRPD